MIIIIIIIIIVMINLMKMRKKFNLRGLILQAKKE